MYIFFLILFNFFFLIIFFSSFQKLVTGQNVRLGC